MEKNRFRDYSLMVMAMAFLSLGKVIHTFPFFSFIGIAPLFSLFYNQRKESSYKFSLLIKIFIVLLVVFVIWNSTYENASALQWLLPVIYSLAILLSFIIYSFTDKYAKNRLGFFTVPIYWLAVEYMMVYSYPEFSRFILASTFNASPSMIGWDVYTGFLGVSLWILVVNILLFYAIFKDDAIFNGKIQWLGLFFTLLVACVPILLHIDANAIVQQDLLSGTATAKQLAGSGEFIGKTAVWVSVLMVLYGFVKKEIR